MDCGDYNMEVELESLRKTRVGGLQWWKPFKRDDMYWLGRDLNDENPLKGLRSVPELVNRWD